MAKKPVNKEPMGKAESILSEAILQVTTKAEDHGETHGSFQMIAEMWSIYMAHNHTIRPEEWVSPRDVAQLMAILKLCRSVYAPKRDHYVDGAGYTGIAAMLEGEEDAV